MITIVSVVTALFEAGCLVNNQEMICHRVEAATEPLKRDEAKHRFHQLPSRCVNADLGFHSTTTPLGPLITAEKGQQQLPGCTLVYKPVFQQQEQETKDWRTEYEEYTTTFGTA